MMEMKVVSKAAFNSGVVNHLGRFRYNNGWNFKSRQCYWHRLSENFRRNSSISCSSSKSKDLTMRRIIFNLVIVTVTLVILYFCGMYIILHFLNSLWQVHAFLWLLVKCKPFHQYPQKCWHWKLHTQVQLTTKYKCDCHQSRVTEDYW